MKVQPRLLRSVALAATLTVAAAGCRDERITGPSAAPGSPAARSVYSATTPPEWRALWHRDQQLYVYDATPEFGLGTHLPNGGYYDTHLAMMQGAGVRMVRMAMYWGLFDPEGDGVYAQSAIDDYHARINLALARGIVPVMVVHGGSPGGNLPGAPIAPNGAAAMNPKLAAFLKFAVQEYDSVKFWQIWNEPDAGYWGQVWNAPSGCTSNRAAQGVGYANTLVMMYDTIKRYAPNDWVVAAGMTGQEQMWPDGNGGCGGHPNPQVTWDFVNAFYPIAKGHFDIMAVHAYGADPYTPDFGPYSKAGQLRAIMAANNDGNRPLWVTEAGTNAGEYLAGDPNRWPFLSNQNDGDVFDLHQRQYYYTLLGNLNSNNPFQKVFGYADFARDGGPGTPPAGAQLNGWVPDDYGNTLLRGDLVTKRKAYLLLDSSAAQIHHPADIDALGGRTSTLNIDTYSEVPKDQPYTYASNDQTITLQNVTVTTLEPTRVDFIIPVVFNVSQAGAGWSGDGWNGHVRGTPGSGVVNGFKMRNGQLPADIALCYTVGYQNASGWQPEECGGQPVGSGASDSRVMQAITMRLIDPQNRGWSVCYSAHMAGAGWTYPEACDGTLAGWGGATVQAIRVHIHRN